jgi:GT2 family glycosyltransferase
MIEIVAATRANEADFWANSALGISLRRLAHDARLVPQVSFTNRVGLPAVFNARLLAPEGQGVLVFVHDDVWIDDYFLVDRILAGLQSYDVIGVAGNRRRVPRQPAWAFVDENFTWDDRANLSGAVAHGDFPFGNIVSYGTVPAQCELLDGVFLAARKSVLRAMNVAFDPRFDFDLYDLDFCRTARERGLRLGTWPICLTHQSIGANDRARWSANYQRYIEKWGN